jgi:type IV secretion/conjugal transfer VirB4 family ATPase
MLGLGRLIKPWSDTGAFSEHVSIWGFVDDTTFLTKRGELGRVLHVPGIDFECLTPEDLSAYTKRFESALKLLDPSYRLYQVLFRHNRPEIPRQDYANPIVATANRNRLEHFARNADRLYRLDIYYVVLYHGIHYSAGIAASLLSRAPRDGGRLLASLFSTAKQTVLIEREIDQARARFDERLNNLLAQLADFLPARVLPKAEAFLVLRRLLNPDPRKSAGPGLKYDTHLDYYLVDSPLTANRDHLELDGYSTRTVTVKEPTAQSWPLVLAALYEIPANYHLVQEWHALPTDAVRKIINAARRHHHTQKTSIVAHMQDSPNASEILVDESKGALVRSLADALTDMEMKGTYFGEWSLTAVVYDHDRATVDRACAEMYKAFSANDGGVYEETYNLLNSFFATIPGGYAHNLRRLLITNQNAADYAFLFTLSCGEPRNPHLGGEYLALLETQHQTPYYFNLHVQDIAHTLVLGKTGSGKSFLLNFLATAAQKYGGYTFFFDLGASFRGITELFGGTYLKVGVRGNDEWGGSDGTPPVVINPFCLESTPENLEFLYAFLRVLLESHDFTLSTADEKDLYTTLRTLYELDQDCRTLKTLADLLSRHLSDRLHKWVHGDPPGQYAFLFDNPTDTLTLSHFLCVDFEGLDKYPQLVEPLLFYLLHRANAVIYDPALTSRLKLFFVDEAWRFFRHPAIARYIIEALKTWRKKNAAMVLSTQSVDDLMKSDLLEVLVESCSTKIFLANPSLNEDLYRETFKLNETAISLVRSLRPKGQLLIVRPDLTKVLNLEVDPRSYWIYTNDPNDNARRDDAIRRFGFEGGLDYLVADKPPQGAHT